MKTKLTSVILMALLLLNLLSGCGNAANDSDGSPSAAEAAPSAGVSAPGDDVPSENNGQVAGEDDMAPAVDLNTEGLTPVYGSDLKDGVYEVDVDSSSSMFKIVACTLSVKNGEMTATMTMGGTGYLYVYMGTGEEAVNAGEGSYTIEVTLSGGSGRASVESPVQLTVENGAATAVIVWSSSNYDYVKVDGVRYLTAGVRQLSQSGRNVVPCGSAYPRRKQAPDPGAAGGVDPWLKPL